MTNDKEEEAATRENEPDLMEESDRGCVIVAAALIEDDLRSLLVGEVKLHRAPKKLVDTLFESNGALATFSGKAAICRAFGLIDEVSYQDITILRKLRNRFAHAADHVDFLDDDILEMIMRMNCCAKTAGEWKVQRFNFNAKDKRPPEYEMRSRGFVKYGKSIFCIGVKNLRINIIQHDIERKRAFLAVARSMTSRLPSGPALSSPE